MSTLVSIGKLAAGTLAISGPFVAGYIASDLASQHLGAAVLMGTVGLAAGFFGFAIFTSIDAQEVLDHDRRLRPSREG